MTGNLTDNLTKGKRYRVSYEGVADDGARWVYVEGIPHVVPDNATVEQLPDPDPTPEPAYKHGRWYLDAAGNPWQYRVTGRFWCGLAQGRASRVPFAEPPRFPDGSLHYIADGGRP